MTRKEAQEFTKKVLNHMRNRLSDYQETYGDLYNLEATPAESTSYRLAKHDKERFPDIITANEGKTPYYTNSSHFPVGFTADIFEALDIQDELQTLYTSGTVFHAFLGERLSDWKAAANLVRKIAEHYRLPYYTISPTYSVCKNHGYITGEVTKCPKCGAPHEYIYDNNGNKGQFKCKVCQLTFKEANYATKPLVFICPYCGATLTEQKQRKQFKIHKCNNSKCSYYQRNIKKLPKDLDPAHKYKYKLHYIYREFNINFFKMDLYPISKHATGFSFKKFNPHIMGLCLTYHVNCKMSTRQTAHVLEEVHGIKISHRTVANYALTAAAVIKPFVDTFNYKPSKILSADETYIKVKGIKHYVWIVMDACKKSILGYQVSDTRATGPCILAMRMAFDKFKKFPGKALNFVADGYSAYPLAKQQFELEENKEFNLTQVIGLTNEDPVSEEFR